MLLDYGNRVFINKRIIAFLWLPDARIVLENGQQRQDVGLIRTIVK